VNLLDTDPYLLALAEVCGAHSALRPPNRVTVAEGAAANFMIVRPGGGAGAWNPLETPYMVEPMNAWASRTLAAGVFVGPSQAGKTAAIGEGAIAHTVINDPGDFLVVQMSQEKAREYSKQRIDRMLRNTDSLREALGGSSKDDNLHDKQFRNGMWLRIAWPTVTNLSSSSYRYVFQTDYDRYPDDIDGEGDAWGLGLARVRTYGSRGMLMAESSPGRPVTDPNWEPQTPHEAPPAKGILGIYNRSDRRRWYWRCPHCLEHFEAAPGIDLFRLPPIEQLLTDIRRIDIGRMARQYGGRIVCPLCAAEIGGEHKKRMNAAGRWVPDGARLTSGGILVGEPRTSSIGGWWLGGVAAEYASWESLVGAQLQALLDYATTGSELSWQTTVNTGQAMPYTPRHVVEGKRALNPRERRDPAYEKHVVPKWARFLLATVDVQGGVNARFVVQVHAIGESLEVPIARFAITESDREGVGGKAPVDPTSVAEDWDLLTERVLRHTYAIEDSELELKVYALVLDTGGEGKKKTKDTPAGKVAENVTEKAYAYWRRMKRQRLHKHVMLTKGVGIKNADWLVRKTDVGGPKGREDVELHLLNSNALKDATEARAKRTDGGAGSFIFPQWLTDAWFDEWDAEVRNADGTWTQIRSRNESRDLVVMARAGCLWLGVDRWRDWSQVPPWALPLDAGNSMVVTRTERREMQDNERVAPMRDDGVRPAEPARSGGGLTRRSGRSGYLG
jgi:phage terminase large subunit GpA-like protein